MFTIFKTLVLESLLVGICIVGDYLLKNPISPQRAVVAVTDSLTHGLVGLLSWSIICDAKMTRHDILECVGCLILAMIVDVDHFISARSFSLQAAVSLPSRPPFHATTLVFLIDIVFVILYYILNLQEFKLLGMMITVAWLSHHIRDAVRRGLWFYPVWETQPLPNELHLGLIMILPLGMKIVYNLWNMSRTRVVGTESIV